jgi:hypothetical protein
MMETTKVFFDNYISYVTLVSHSIFVDRIQIYFMQIPKSSAKCHKHTFEGHWNTVHYSKIYY